MRGLLLSLFVALGLALYAQPALAVTCAQQNASELMQRGDVAATGVVDFGWSVPFGFVFAADHVYKGNLPAHVLVLGQFRPSDLGATRHFLVMRFTCLASTRWTCVTAARCQTRTSARSARRAHHHPTSLSARPRSASS